MCLRLSSVDRVYGDSLVCLMSIGPYALNELNEFVIELDTKDVEGNYEQWLPQRIAGKVFGALGYAAIMVATIVESVAILVLSLLALVPSVFLSCCYGDLFTPVFQVPNDSPSRISRDLSALHFGISAKYLDGMEKKF